MRTKKFTPIRLPDAATAFSWAHKQEIPCYDVNLMGYPKRMREWNGGS